MLGMDTQLQPQLEVPRAVIEYSKINICVCVYVCMRVFQASNLH